MFPRFLLALTVLGLSLTASLTAQENFVGSFAEPRDGGNLDTTLSTFDGTTVVIVPRAHASEAVGGASRWRNVLFAIRGVQGRQPAFLLPLVSPGSGRMILSGDVISFQNINLVWSYRPNAVQWNTFDRHSRTGTNSSNWKIEARNDAPFEQDVVYVSINEHFPVSDFYEWLEADVFTHPLVKSTPSETSAGTFVIGYQSGAPASTAFSRPIPDMPLFGFVIRDPAAVNTKLVILVSGQHPYEGQNKVALQGALDWILNATTAEAKAYRANYTTIVYPFVNPTGELAGLWRGTAYQPSKDTNRNWHTTETVPSRNRGIDTVIVHKNAMKRDIAALGLGEPYAMFDYHQNFGDRPGALDYVLHSTFSSDSSASVSRRAAVTDFGPYLTRLNSQASMTDMPSDLTTQETLRGYMVARGVTLPLTFERSVYHTLASEWSFGVATVQALVDSAMMATEVPPPVPPVETEPVVTEPAPTNPLVTEPVTPPVVDPAPEPVETVPVVTEPVLPVAGGDVPPTSEPAATLLIADTFTAAGKLPGRVPQTTNNGAAWSVETGAFTVAATGGVNATNSARAVIDAGEADVDVDAQIAFGSNGAGLILRSSDKSNYLRLTLTGTGWFFQKTADGLTTTLARGSAVYALNTAHTVKVTMNGPAILMSVDGRAAGSLTEAFNATATRHGLLCSNTGLRTWSSFSVTKL